MSVGIVVVRFKLKGECTYQGAVEEAGPGWLGGCGGERHLSCICGKVLL